jgi:hypothetical protein
MKYKGILIAALVAEGLCRSVALADYAHPPRWSGDTDFTHQIWEFYTDAVPLIADDVDSNSFGDPTMTELYLAVPQYMFWEPDAMGYAIGRYGMWGGMPIGISGDEVAMSMTFSVPNVERPEPWYKELWLQVAYWGSIDAGGQVLTVEIARDAEFTNVYRTYDAQADDIEDISTSGAGTSGQFWRFTHAFSLSDQPATEYVRVSLIRDDSAAVFIDQVSIDTHCVQTSSDFDESGYVDLADYAWFQRCITGLGDSPSLGCMRCDLDHDDDVDLDDYSDFAPTMTGPGGGG